MSEHIEQIEQAIRVLRSIDSYVMDCPDRERIGRAIRILTLQVATMREATKVA